MTTATKRKPGAVIGRPRWSATDDPESIHVQVFTQALIDQARRTGVSESRVIGTVIGLLRGRPDGKPENIDAMLKGLPFQVVKDKDRSDIDELASEWRKRNVFRPDHDNLARELRRRRSHAAMDARGWWFSLMRIAWTACLQGCYGDYAEWLTESVSEGDYFRHRMQPVLAFTVALRGEGLKEAQLPRELMLLVLAMYPDLTGL
ncbi:MAG: hypothetical protein ACR2KT_09705 [Methylocella sp.]|nr:MAG: hypothetical protein DLM68_03905 [Hyphomicrobiales bacterium]